MVSIVLMCSIYSRLSNCSEFLGNVRFLLKLLGNFCIQSQIFHHQPGWGLDAPIRGSRNEQLSLCGTDADLWHLHITSKAGFDQNKLFPVREEVLARRKSELTVNDPLFSSIWVLICSWFWSSVSLLCQNSQDVGDAPKKLDCVSETCSASETKWRAKAQTEQPTDSRAIRNGQPHSGIWGARRSNLDKSKPSFGTIPWKCIL